MEPFDTIAAIGTAPGEAGISIVRISGPETFAILDRVCRCRGPRPSERGTGTLLHGFTHDTQGDIDEVLVLLMRRPHSYTREDMAEIQGHGGNQSARRNLRLVQAAGARLAQPGEFTQRAFLNGRLDLVQAEAVLDLIRARSDRAASAALDQLEGGLSAKFNDIYDTMLAVAADLEATLDFPEDELPPTVLADLTRRLAEIHAQMDQLVAGWDEGRVLREGARVVIAGRPNVGKSTLLNALLETDRAIVSPTPGTTRDTIEEGLVLEGIPLILVDTAGLRETTDDVEREGIRRARGHIEKADLFIYLLDASQSFAEEERARVAELDPARCIIVLNKIDLGRAIWERDVDRFRAVATALTEPGGVEEIRKEMAALLQGELSLSVEPSAVISERHRSIILEASAQLDESSRLLAQGREDQVVLAASLLRDALEGLGTATGRCYHDELLRCIFSRFCIGK